MTQIFASTCWILLFSFEYVEDSERLGKGEMLLFVFVSFTCSDHFLMLINSVFPETQLIFIHTVVLKRILINILPTTKCAFGHTDDHSPCWICMSYWPFTALCATDPRHHEELCYPSRTKVASSQQELGMIAQRCSNSKCATYIDGASFRREGRIYQSEKTAQI